MNEIRSTLLIAILSVGLTLTMCAGLHKIVDTFLYICFLSIPISLLMTSTVILVFKRLRMGSNTSKMSVLSYFSSIMISTLFSFSFLTTVPLNIDRSFSVWMLTNIDDAQNRGASVDLDYLNTKISDFFSPGSGEIDRRLQEQISLGNIKVINREIVLTSRGENQVKINRFFAKVFFTNEKYTK
jgi:hypothetical protein